MSRRVTIRDGRTILLRQAVPDDAEAIIQGVDGVAREGRYFLRSRFEMDVEKERAFIAKRAEQGDLFLVAILDGRLVGWVTLFRPRHEFRRHTGELGMGVVRGFRGAGIGTMLMAYTLEWAAEQGLEKVNLGVRVTNERAQALYQKFGFVPEGRRVRDIKDQKGRYDDTIEMAYFVDPVSEPLALGERGDDA